MRKEAQAAEKKLKWPFVIHVHAIVEVSGHVWGPVRIQQGVQPVRRPRPRRDRSMAMLMQSVREDLQHTK